MNQKNHKRLNLYRVDMKYIRDLQKADNKVLSVSPQINKEKRVFIGTVVVNNNQLYLIPLSHAKPKHINMKSSADFEKIYDKNDKLLSVLNFNLMIPVTHNQLIPVDYSSKNTDSAKERAYKQLCINEITYCRSISKKISDKAKILYRLCTDPNSNYNGKNRCLDFPKLESVCKKYNEKHF